MIEQEVKILNIDTEKLVDALLKYGAKRKFSGFVTDTIFSHPTKFQTSSMRLRKMNATHYVTFKKKIPDTQVKKAIEIECLIHNYPRFLQSIQEQ